MRATPIGAAGCSLLDGHVMLSRGLAEAGHFPAIDVLSNVSRVMPDVVSETHSRLATQLREVLATRQRVEDLVAVGAYQAGSDPRVDLALSLFPTIEGFLRQPPTEASSFDDALAHLAQILENTGTA